MLIESLIDKGFLLEIKDDLYRSLHMDVAIRASDIRIKHNGTRYVTSARLFTYRVSFMSIEDRVYLPQVDSRLELERMLYKNIEENLGKELVEVYIRSLREYINWISGGKSKGLDIYQLYSVLRILQLFNERKVFTICAPTGA